jgi:Ca2+-binding RTX toxin-like protein
MSMTYITLDKDYGYTPYSVSGLSSGSVIDATKASWIEDNSSIDYPDATHSTTSGTGQISTYPFKVKDAGSGLVVKGGHIWGQVPQDSDWQYTYNNSAGIRVENTPNVVIDDWRLDKTWDAIRIAGGASNFLINDTHVSNARDDAVENDYVMGGTIRDSLFDGVFSGISLGDANHYDGSMNTVKLDGVFMRMQSYLFKGQVTHVSPFKTDTGAPQTTPDIRIVNSVIAIEDPNHASQARLKLAWDHVVESHGNVFLNLSNTPLPSTYPKPPAGFTILQGQEARDYWAASKAAWLDNHDGTPYADVTPLPPIPGGGTTSSITAPTTSTSTTSTSTSTTTTDPHTITGTSSANTLVGTSGADHIDGLAGTDKIFGKGGADILTGGAGHDKFVFDTKLDGHAATITDFNTAEDALWLDNSVFTKLGSGSLSSPQRLAGTYFEHGDGVVANDSNDHVLYDSHTGVLSYDPDGNGSAAPIPIAHLSAHLDLTKYDIFVV